MSDENSQQDTRSPMEKAQEMVSILAKATQEAKTEADRLQTLKQEQMLSGTGGIRPSMPEPKIETPKEYALKAMRGEMNGKSS